MRKLAMRPFERGEPERMLRKASSPRDKALIVLLWRGGLRANEARTALVEDFETFDNGSIRLHVVKGKGSKQRFVGFGPKYSKILRKQLRRRKSGVFLDTRKGATVAPNQFRRTIQNIGADCLVKGRPHCHRFRHSFARDLHDEGKSVLEIGEALGHTNLNTTQIYLQDLGILGGVVDYLMERE